MSLAIERDGRFLSVEKEDGKKDKLGDLDVAFAVGLYTIANTRIPNNDNIRLLRIFADMTLRQTSAGYDEIADGMTDSNGKEISKVYWPSNVREQYKEFVSELKKFPLEHGQIIMGAAKEWFKCFHYWELLSRNVNPTPNLIASESPSIVDTQCDIRRYRDSSNFAYAKAVFTILDPNPDHRQQQDVLLHNTYWPALMLFQTSNDFGQFGLLCQLAKPTMDKISGRSYDQMSLIPRITALAQDLIDVSRPYYEQTQNNSGTIRGRAVNTALILGNAAYFAYNVVRYQVKKDTKGRFMEDIGRLPASSPKL